MIKKVLLLFLLMCSAVYSQEQEPGLARILENCKKECVQFGEEEMRWYVPWVTLNQIGEMSALADDEKIPDYIRMLGSDYLAIQIACGEGTWKDGSPIKIGIVDTGIDKIHTTGDLTNNKGRIDSTNSQFGPFDRHGHGTWCLCATSATKDGKGIAGVATKAWNYSAKGLGDSGSGSVDAIAACVDWCVAQGCDVISMSLGGSFSQTIDNACKRAHDKGVLVFASIGNSGAAGGGHPGTSKYTIGVGAIDYTWKAARFSSIDPKCDLTDFGVNTLSSGLDGRYAGMSGTSMSCPIAAGKAVLLLGYMDRLGKRPSSNEEFLQMMEPHFKDLGTPGRDTTYGRGWMNIESFIKANPLDGPIIVPPPPPPVTPPTPPVTPPTPPVTPPKTELESLKLRIQNIEATLKRIEQAITQKVDSTAQKVKK